MSDPTLFTACLQWSPDGKRLACGGFGEPDSSRNGIYTIRSSDGGGLTRMTSNPGGEDMPGDYSPNGKRFVFARFDQNGDPVGSRRQDRRQPPATDHSFGDDRRLRRRLVAAGNAIVFARRVRADMRNSLWVVQSDERAARDSAPSATWLRGPISYPTSRGCIHPRWSPDGKKIIFTETATGEVENVYTVNADGTGLTQITHGGAADGTPDWGTHSSFPKTHQQVRLARRRPPPLLFPQTYSTSKKIVVKVWLPLSSIA